MKLGVLGLGRRGLFRIEQLRQTPVATVAGYDPVETARSAAEGLVQTCSASVIDFWQSGPFDGILIAVPAAEQGRALRDAIGRSVPVAVDSSQLAAYELVDVLRDFPNSAKRMLMLAATNLPDLRATAAIGEIQRARYVSREYGLPGENLDGQLANVLLQLRSVMPAPTQVICHRSSNAAGEVLKLSIGLRDAAARTAEIELQRDSLVSERGGWTIEGTEGTLCRQRIYRRLADGEITDEPVSNPAVAATLPWWELLQDPWACQDSVAAAEWLSRILAAVSNAAHSGAWTSVPGLGA